MRFAMVFSLVMLALGHESASAQSGVAVVRFGKHTNVDAPCTQPTMGTDPACVATVLEVQDTKSLILQAKNDAKSEATAECTNQITAAKTDLTRDLNAIPSKAM